MKSRADDYLLARARRMANRTRAETACLPCKAKKAKCNDYRPCKRCLDSGRDLCIDGSSSPRENSPPALGMMCSTVSSIMRMESAAFEDHSLGRRASCHTLGTISSCRAAEACDTTRDWTLGDVQYGTEDRFSWSMPTSSLVSIYLIESAQLSIILTGPFFVPLLLQARLHIEHPEHQAVALTPQQQNQQPEHSHSSISGQSRLLAHDSWMPSLYNPRHIRPPSTDMHSSPCAVAGGIGGAVDPAGWACEGLSWSEARPGRTVELFATTGQEGPARRTDSVADSWQTDVGAAEGGPAGRMSALVAAYCDAEPAERHAVGRADYHAAAAAAAGSSEGPGAATANSECAAGEWRGEGPGPGPADGATDPFRAGW